MGKPVYVVFFFLCVFCSVTVLAVRYIPPRVESLFIEDFQNEPMTPVKWIRSSSDKYNGRFVVREAAEHHYQLFAGDKRLTAPKGSSYYAACRVLDTPIDPTDGDMFIIQYDFRVPDRWDCNGGYLKFMSDTNFDAKAFPGEQKFNIMFGPDRCGKENRVHFIIQMKDQKTGKSVEHHMTTPPELPVDQATHHYQLVIDMKAQTFEINIDLKNVKQGSLKTFQPKLEVVDVKDIRPKDWVLARLIPDVTAIKPASWNNDAPEYIPDPNIAKPSEWDESVPEYINDPTVSKPDKWDDKEDGEWIHPQIPNPVCSTSGCGKWVAPFTKNSNFRGKWKKPLIINPAYKGEWKPQNIVNPEYFSFPKPTKALLPITAICIEWWLINPEIALDNIVIGRNKRALDIYAHKTSLRKGIYEDKMYLDDLMGEKKRKSEAESAKPVPFEWWRLAVVGSGIIAIISVFWVMKVKTNIESNNNKNKKKKKE